MEGTRNERVAILLASYVIGFITAYIAFGVVQLETNLQFAQVASQNTASVIGAMRQEPGEAFIAMDKEGLVLIKNNQRTLLSATQENSDIALFNDGAHVAIAEYSLSPDKTHVYFCEVPTEESDSCRPYIYSVEKETVYPVTVNGQRVAFDTEEANTTWSETNELIIN